MGSTLRVSLPRVADARQPLRRLTRRFDAGVLLVALVAALAALAAAIARIMVVGHGSLGFLVSAGRVYSNRTLLPANIPVRRGTGYDGQFMYRLAHSPLDWHTRAGGIRLDGAFRLGRIGYPLLVWLVSAGGQPSLLPVMMLAVGVVAIAALAGLGAAYVRECALAPGWGLLACWPGLLFSVDFDLAEPLEVALVVAGLLAVRRGRPGWAAAALSAAVLTRETALVAVAAVAVLRLPELWRQRRIGRRDLAWIAPLIAFGGWQFACRIVTGRFPITSDAGSNAQAPFAGAINAWPHWVTIARAHPVEAWTHAFELMVLVLVVGAGLVSARNAAGFSDPFAATAAFGTAAACSLSVAVWSSASDLRMFADTYAAAALVLLSCKPRRSLLSWAIVLAALAIAIAVYRARVV